jgi:putative addiction module killer protein
MTELLDYSMIRMGYSKSNQSKIVEVSPCKVKIYETEDGRVPFSQWLNALKDVQASARILLRIDRAQQGNFGDCKFIVDGMFEFRIDTGAGYRVYFGRVSDELIVILWGGDKSSQQRDIDKAQQFWVDYRSQEDV